MKKKTTARRSGGGRSTRGAAGSSKFAKMFGKGKEAYSEGEGQFGREELDDGVYNAQLHSMEYTTSQKGREQVAEHWVIKSGEHKGKKVYSYQGMDTDERVPYFIDRLDKLGYDGTTIEDQDDLEAMLKEITKEKPVAKIRLKTKGEYQNLYIQKLIDEDDIEDDEEDEGEEEEETEEDDEEEEETPKRRGKRKPADDDEEDDEEEEEEPEDDDEEEEEEVEVKKGTVVSFKYKNEKLTGKVVKVDEEEERVIVKVNGKPKPFRVAFADVSLPDDDDDDNEEEEEEIPEDPDVDEDEEEEDDEEEEETPRKRQPRKKVTRKKAGRR